eukprot:m.713831 g.713831  ORF g.713831 m.713831 type:complete len:50 (-) comp22971_c1_seq54:52-201(-)
MTSRPVLDSTSLDFSKLFARTHGTAHMHMHTYVFGGSPCHTSLASYVAI